MNAFEQYLADNGDNILSLAERAGVAPSTISRPLRGERDVSMDTARAVERATRGKVSASTFVAICLEAAKGPPPPRRKARPRREPIQAA